MAALFRVVPAVVEAVQFTGTNGGECKNLVGEKWIPDSNSGSYFSFQGWDGGMVIAGKGDWIVRGITGHYFSVSAADFPANYEPVLADQL